MGTSVGWGGGLAKFSPDGGPPVPPQKKNPGPVPTCICFAYSSLCFVKVPWDLGYRRYKNCFKLYYYYHYLPKVRITRIFLYGIHHPVLINLQEGLQPETEWSHITAVLSYGIHPGHVDIICCDVTLHKTRSVWLHFITVGFIGCYSQVSPPVKGT